MADNKLLPPTGTGTADIRVATRAVTYSGDTSEIQVVGLAVFAGADDAKTVTDIALTAAGAMPVTSVGGGTNSAGQTTVTNSSTAIIAAREGRRAVLIVNQQTVVVYVNPAGAATTSHFRLDPGAGMVIPVTTAINGITSAAYSAVGDAKVHYLEIY